MLKQVSYISEPCDPYFASVLGAYTKALYLRPFSKPEANTTSCRPNRTLALYPGFHLHPRDRPFPIDINRIPVAFVSGLAAHLHMPGAPLS